MFIFFNKCYYAFIKKFVLKKAHGGTRTRNFQIRSLTRYPIASHGHYLVRGSNPWPHG